MRVTIAPDTFKGSLSALEVARAMAEGVRRADPRVVCELVPMADGGDGTVQALVDATGGERITHTVHGPLGEPVEATFGLLGDGETAVIEMAQASGLVLVPPDRRNPLLTATYGTGELIREALRRGRRKLIVGIGGSATNDGGAGMAQALGWRFLDAKGEEIEGCGGNLNEVERIDGFAREPLLAEAEIRVACDVRNPLTGPQGAAAVYGPQKGATPEMVATLDVNLHHLAAIIERDVGVQVETLPGAGAAGGLGAGLVAFCGAKLERGVKIVIEAVRLRERMEGSALVFTGEGQLDAQTLHGKTPLGVAQVAAELGIPVIALGGSVTPEARALHEHHFAALFSIVSGPMPLAEAMEPNRARTLLSFAAEEAIRAVRLRL
jgi:glycerate kinase